VSLVPTWSQSAACESDKSQPGRHWYSRSLAFHAFLCRSFGWEAREVADRIDWLFKQVHARLVLSQERKTVGEPGRGIDPEQQRIDVAPGLGGIDRAAREERVRGVPGG
jgi:hypothetical protein